MNSTTKNLIFDFGNVIIDIDFQLTFDQFKAYMGADEYQRIFARLEESDFYQKTECSSFTGKEMTTALNALGASLTEKQVVTAWNALLLELPHERIELLQQLSKQYRLFMLSNTNLVHITEIWKRLFLKYHHNPLEQIFEKMYLSYEIGVTKPQPEIYNYLLQDADLVASECLFLDDLQKNLDGAAAFGIQTQKVTKEKGILEFFGTLV